MATKKTTGGKGKLAVEIAAGLLAAGAAAAAGYYFYADKNAKKHRKIAAKWASDMKQEVMREAKRLGEVDARTFAKVVDSVAATYRGARAVNAADLKRAASELKSNWEMVQKEMQKTGRASAKSVKAVGKKAVAKGAKTVKKVVKKAAKAAKKR